MKRPAPTSLILDSGGVIALGRRDRQAAARIAVLRRRGQWPPIVPAAVLAESLAASPIRNTLISRIVGLSVVAPLDEPLARRAAQLRSRARTGSAVEACVVATAELLDALVVTGNSDDLTRLCRHANGVSLLPACGTEEI
jgi:hypothetical protein